MAKGAETTVTIYAHRKRREEWGLAILASEEEDRRVYQFEDGTQRTFKKGYWELLEPVTLPEDEAPLIVRHLRTILKQAINEEGTEPQTADLGFAAVHKAFLSSYPTGLSGDEYAKKVRGVDAPRRFKRHRDAAIEDAQTRFAEETIRAQIEAGEHDKVRDAVVEVLGATDLVTKKTLEPLQKLSDEALPKFTESFAELLYGGSLFEAHFERLVQVLESTGSSVRWSLVTAPTALYRPNDHVYVKASTFKHFVQRFGPPTGWNNRPTGWLYGRIQTMAQELADELRKVEDPPRDMLDVSFLVTVVFRPKGLDLLVD